MSKSLLTPVTINPTPENWLSPRQQRKNVGIRPIPTTLVMPVTIQPIPTIQPITQGGKKKKNQTKKQEKGFTLDPTSKYIIPKRQKKYPLEPSRWETVHEKNYVLVQTISCPNCKRRIEKEKCYASEMKCPYCNQIICGICDRKQHLGFTCNDFNNFLLMIESFKVEGERYLDEIKTKNPELKQQSYKQFNSLLKYNCGAWRRFSIGMRERGYTLDKEEKGLKLFNVKECGFFAWHGSSEVGVKGICKEGFDPKFRNGQAYGKGEYFSMNADVSKAYLRSDSHHMILSYIINGTVSRIQDNYCYVVPNPDDFHSSYCLPVSVLSVNVNSPVDWFPKEE